MYLKLSLSICCVGFICSFIMDGNPVPHFSLAIDNVIRDPVFSQTFNLTITNRNKTLMSYIEETCDANNNLLNFSMTYFPQFGYYISGFNGISEVSGELFWDLTEHSGGEMSQIGASKYIPKPGDLITFNLTDLTAYPVVHLSPHLLALLVDNH